MQIQNVKQSVYKLIYSRHINYILRNINWYLSGLLPEKIKIPPSGILKVKIANGRALQLYTNQTNYLTQLLFWQGHANFEYTSIFLKLIQKVSTFYDIGANIGYYSLLAAAQNKEVKVVGFEPASGPLHYFKKNVSVNNFSERIKTEPIALSQKEGELKFYERKSLKYHYLKHNLAGDGSAVGNDDASKNFNIRKVKTLTLDSYVKSSKENRIDLIKMDTEGTEHLILKSASYVLIEWQPIIICETLFNTTESDLEEILIVHGYEFYNHVDKGLEKVNKLSREQDNGVRNCFFVHPSKYHLIAEFVLN